MHHAPRQPCPRHDLGGMEGDVFVWRASFERPPCLQQRHCVATMKVPVTLPIVPEWSWPRFVHNRALSDVV